MILSRSVFAFVCCFFSLWGTYAQQKSQSWIFAYDPLLYNGAYAGVNDGVACMMHLNKQWVNLEGSPLSFILSGSTLWRNVNLGVGASFSYQSIGINERKEAATDLAYRIRISDSGILSMSVGGNYLWNSYNDSDLANSESDAVWENLPEQRTSLSGQVAFWYESPSWSVALSAKGLGNTVHSKDYGCVLVPHGYLSLSKSFSWTKDYMLKLQSIVMGAENAPFSFLLEPNLDYDGRWNLGLLYEIDHYVGALFKVFATEHFYVSASYSYAINALAKTDASSSFELMLGFRFSKEVEKNEWD